MELMPSINMGAGELIPSGRWKHRTLDSNSVAGGTEPVPDEGSGLPDEDAGVLVPDDDGTPPPPLSLRSGE